MMMGKDGNDSDVITRKLVFIFKAMKENHLHDKYQEILEVNDIPYAVIPVLSFEFVNRNALVEQLSYPDRLGAIILSSTRAVEALVSALSDSTNSVRELLCALQCFVVGPATYEAANAAGFKPEGEDSGNGSSLAEYILRKVKDTSKPLLFPCSSIRRENIPDVLKSKGLTVTEIIAYETHPDEHIGEYTTNAVQEKGVPEYTVFFSPSGFKHVHASACTLPFALETTKIIALGPATAAAVTEKGLKLHGTTDRPDPESLWHLLQESMTKSSCES